MGDLVWFPVTSVKPDGLLVQVPHLQMTALPRLRRTHWQECAGDGAASGHRAASSTSTSHPPKEVNVQFETDTSAWQRD